MLFRKRRAIIVFANQAAPQRRRQVHGFCTNAALRAVVSEQDSASQLDRSAQLAMAKLQRLAETAAPGEFHVEISQPRIDQRSFVRENEKPKHKPALTLLDCSTNAALVLRKSRRTGLRSHTGPKAGSLRHTAELLPVSKSTLQRWSVRASDAAVPSNPWHRLDPRGGHNRRISYQTASLLYYSVESRQNEGLFTNLPALSRLTLMFEAVFPQHRTLNTSAPGESVLSRLIAELVYRGEPHKPREPMAANAEGRGTLGDRQYELL